MTNETPTKRKRGGQPGNKNAKGNRGNPHPRNNLGHYIGRGAPIGNQYARKHRKPHEDVLVRYGDDPELAAWVVAHADELDKGHFTADDVRDPALYCGHMGWSVDRLIENRLEYLHKCYTTLEDTSITGDAEDTDATGLRGYDPLPIRADERLSQDCCD